MELELSFTCRTCLSEGVEESDFIDLDSFMLGSLRYLDCLNFCSQLKAKMSDALPIHICLICSKALEFCYDFVIKSRNADSILRAKLKKKNNSPRIYTFDYEMEEDETGISLEQKTSSKETVTQETEAWESFGRSFHSDFDLGELKIKEICSEKNKRNKYFEKLQIKESPSRTNQPNDQCIQPEELNMEVEKDNTETNDELLEPKNITIINEAENLETDENATKEFFDLVNKQDETDKLRLSRKLSADTNSLGNIDNQPNTIMYECDGTYESKECLEEHIKGIHPDRKQHSGIYDSCGQENQYNLKGTKKIEVTKVKKSEEKFFLCSLCPKQLTGKRQLKLHETYCHSETTEKKFQCDQCTSKFVSKFRLKRHIKAVHVPFKFECHLCGRLFKLRFILNNHLKRHEERKIYLCPQCDKSYIGQAELKVHMRVHTGERPYQCTMCDESFIVASRLKTHIALDHSNEIVKCPHCNEKFIGGKTSRYHKHMYQHTGMPYKCEICSVQFDSRTNIRNHMKSTHQIDISEMELVNMFHKNMGRYAKHDIRFLKELKDNEIEDQLENSQNESVIEDQLENTQNESVIEDIKEDWL